jgi:hypothetical protein
MMKRGRGLPEGRHDPRTGFECGTGALSRSRGRDNRKIGSVKLTRHSLFPRSSLISPVLCSFLRPLPPVSGLVQADPAWLADKSPKALTRDSALNPPWFFSRFPKFRAGH